jgi:hypothetical protein
VWAERWGEGAGFGKWRLHVAALRWTDGVPSLVNLKTRKTDGFVEPYGWDTKGRVLFAADTLAGVSWDNLAIMALPSSLAGEPQWISPREPAPATPWANYNEFAFQIPGTERLVIARSVGAFYFSLEYWTVGLDGSDPQQLSSFSVPFSRWYHGFPSMAGGVAFDPADPMRMAAGFCLNYEGSAFKASMVTMGES